ncbi:unnamed protein product [Effrenium voratum]|uniref:Uncharacterized protein n=1 Tax=Effrenium voratum TaxID=2562239 RepID=A0AA36J8F0_9DINO|nr:unnamed protein product [Effrenium voratum]
MAKRPRDPRSTASAASQFHTLRQIPSIGPAQCRQIVAVLDADGRGTRVQQRRDEVHGEVMEHLQVMDLPAKDPASKVQVSYMSVAGVLQAKCNACPLFHDCLRAIAQERDNQLTLVVYLDECTPGNVLSPDNARKSNLTYWTILQLPHIYLEDTWLTLSVSRTSEISALRHGMVTLAAALLRAVRAETVSGVPVELSGSAELLFFDRVLLLADHEGLRAATGCKGSSGMKPCLKCANVMNTGYGNVRWHVTVAEPDITSFVPQTQNSLRAAIDHLSTMPTKTSLGEAEKLLGWKLEEASASFLLAPDMQEWCELDSCTFDAMHALWSNGIVGQELGYWYTALRRKANLSLTDMRRYVELGWHGVGRARGINLLSLFTVHLWREGADFRGDAGQALFVLSICVQFSEDIAIGLCADMRREHSSLEALHRVCLCVLETKRDTAHGSHLARLQAEHIRSFAAVYGADKVRPKLHYSLHLQQQCWKWGRLVDCFTCERKHRAFKRVARRQQMLARFSQQCLLELASAELRSKQPAKRLLWRLDGRTTENVDVGAALGATAPATLAPRALGPDTISRGDVLIPSPAEAFEVLGVTSVDSRILLLIHVLEPADLHFNTTRSGRSKWTRASTLRLHAVHIESVASAPRAMHMREERIGNTTHIWLLE